MSEPAGNAGLRRRVRRWFLDRLPRTDSWTLGQRNVYILPTKAGLVFACTLFVMLLASINYQLNLGYALTFLLAGAGIVSMHLTHGTLRGLTLHLRPTAPAFAGEPLRLEIVITNPGAERHGVALHFDDRASHGPSFAWCDVPALGQTTATLQIVPPTRGLHAVPTVVAESAFPFGLFRAWTLWRPASQLLAYPRPEHPAPPLPPAVPRPGEPVLRRRGEGVELDGVRAWRRGDALRHIVWKKVARTGKLVSRETSGGGTRELALQWQATRAGGGSGDAREQRLSRLAAWILAAERQGLLWRLEMPGHDGTLGQGDQHRHAALRLLALWSGG